MLSITCCVAGVAPDVHAFCGCWLPLEIIHWMSLLLSVKAFITTVFVGTSSRNGRLNTLGHFEKKAYKVLLWLQPYQSACMPCNGIHCYQTGSQNYLIGWAGQLMKLLPLINLLLPA